MSDCGCDKAKAELEEYLHNELCKEDAADVREHMANCVSCTEEHRVGLVLTEAVRRACKETAPEDLRTQVLASLRGMQSQH
ncbi:zf-HC2 domain-containing protein [Compostimonas suwonensis]|uniref:Mycothiol system anti-sigma-R factor n=1 Tax=Compostimonas suwonensis TaxID=1048394 RepID=A0A2M9BUP0_9MICO|nr:zf-HC2 domain-containing protein [Compostimonas suwonensis]PJJ61659.1 mycothiol system anti-sigma-R factor [Compostimonas suwonensis]